MEARALVKATRSAEAPDPVLPTAWRLGQRSVDGGVVANKQTSPLDTLLNVLAVAFLVWLAWLVIRREKVGT